jgi:hypothetical protein
MAVLAALGQIDVAMSRCSHHDDARTAGEAGSDSGHRLAGSLRDQTRQIIGRNSGDIYC